MQTHKLGKFQYNSTSKYYIKSSNLSIPFTLKSNFESEAIIDINPENRYHKKWFYSQNNSYLRSKIYELSNNKANIDQYQFDAEAAVFSGNLLRLILGPFQPEYYLCEIDSYQEMKLKHPYARACNAVDEFCEWYKCVKVKDGKIKIFDSIYPVEAADKIPIKGLTAILTAGCFLDEQD